MCHRVINRLHCVGNITCPGIIKHAEIHHAGPPHHACNSQRIITLCGDDAGHSGTMTLLILDLATICNVIPTMQIATL
jgi:hypothetical protein